MSAGTPKVELLLAAVWTDITTYARVADGISIKRGRQDEASSPASAQCTLTLDNTDGRFSPRNAAGAYYGSIGRNTRIRVSVLNDSAVYKVRFSGVVSEWPPTWDPTGRNVTTTIIANGIRRRLQSGAIPLLSPYRRAMASQTNVIGYWPMEDGSDATSFASGLVGGTQGAFFGAQVAPAADATFAAATALPTMGDFSQFTFPVATYSPAAGGQQIRMLFKASVTAGPISWVMQVRTTGAHMFELDYAPTADTFTITLINQDTGLTEATSGAIGPWEGQGKQLRLSFALRQNGANIDYGVAVLPTSDTTGLAFNGTFAAATLGLLTRIDMFNGTGMSTTVGHLSMENQQTSLYDLAAVLDGYAGEDANDRVTRLTTEEGVTAVIDDTRVYSELMGSQGESTFLELFDEAASVDGGISTEQVDDFGLVWRARSDMYSQAAQLALTYTDLNGLAPVDDDQALSNDVTVNRKSGSSGRAIADTGTLTPALVGEYAASYDLSLYTDGQAAYQAQWRMNEGTIDAPRWPEIVFDALVKFNSTKRDNLIALREGDLVSISSAPAFTGGAYLIRVLVNGWTETITETAWLFALNCSPVGPFDVVVLGDATFARLDFEGSTLNSSMTTAATSLSLATATGKALATTSAGDMPYDINVDGERMTVTAAAGSSSPQTLTVTRSVNGVVKTHASGATVSLAQPNHLGL